jgi:hypothetical protein
MLKLHYCWRSSIPATAKASTGGPRVAILVLMAGLEFAAALMAGTTSIIRAIIEYHQSALLKMVRKMK